MASVDFSFYYGHFVPKFLETVEGLTEEQQATLVLNYRVVEVSQLLHCCHGDNSKMIISSSTYHPSL